jgi:hypothetical protein
MHGAFVIENLPGEGRQEENICTILARNQSWKGA